MASQGRFPKPYQNDVPVVKGGDEGVMQYVEFDNLGIGARPSGTPKNVSDIKSLDHVGGSASGGKN